MNRLLILRCWVDGMIITNLLFLPTWLRMFGMTGRLLWMTSVTIASCGSCSLPTAMLRSCEFVGISTRTKLVRTWLSGVILILTLIGPILLVTFSPWVI